MGDDILKKALLLDVFALAVESEQLLDNRLPRCHELQLSLSIDGSSKHWQFFLIRA